MTLLLTDVTAWIIGIQMFGGPLLDLSLTAAFCWLVGFGLGRLLLP